MKEEEAYYFIPYYKKDYFFRQKKNIRTIYKTLYFQLKRKEEYS